MSKQEPVNLREVVADQGSIRAAARYLGVAESTLRGRLRKLPPLPIPDNAFVPADDELPSTHVGDQGVETDDRWAAHQQTGGVRRYILTSAQNNVHVHEGFLANLKALARATDAELMVGFALYDRAGYRGLTRQGESQTGKRDVWWDSRIREFAVSNRVRLHKRLAFCGELDVLATARDPLSGLEAYCGRSSVIVGHNKFAMRCVESRPHQMPKEMFTTGSVTPQKFIQRKAGQLAHFHHVLGALLVEVTEDGYWHVHHLNAEDDGSFYWLDKQAANGRVTQHGKGLAGLILGDIHVEKGDAAVTDLTVEVIAGLYPKTIVLHDLIDFRSRNHHNRKDPIFQMKMHLEKTSVVEELAQAAQFTRSLIDAGSANMRVVVARGNHDGALDRWLKETDWRDDPVNAELYLELAAAMVRAAREGRRFNALETWIGWQVRQPIKRGGRNYNPRVDFLGVNDSHEIAGIECGMHGHVGPSGTRGMPKQFSRMGFKTFTGHTHTPSIYDGAYTVGVTGNLNMGYNIGPSKWMHCHGIIYPNGKRAFLFLKNGGYRA